MGLFFVIGFVIVAECGLILYAALHVPDKENDDYPQDKITKNEWED